MANTWTKNYADGTALFESDLDDLAGTLQPEKANLALATTGSSSGDLLVSAGSNTTPSWSTPNTVAATITSTGANAIFGNISSAQASVSTLIVAQATGTATYGASLANSLHGAVSSCQASVANLCLGAVSSCQATVANLIAAAISSVTATVANVIGQAMGASGANAVLGTVSSVNASAANLIIGNVSSAQASVANLILGAVSSCQSTISNLIANARTRNNSTDGSDPGEGGISTSFTSGTYTQSTTISAFTDITNLETDLNCSGNRGIIVESVSRGGNVSYLTLSGTGSATVELMIRSITDGSDRAAKRVTIYGGEYVDPHLKALDFPTSGTKQYRLQLRCVSASQAATITLQDLYLTMYEL